MTAPRPPSPLDALWRWHGANEMHRHAPPYLVERALRELEGNRAALTPMIDEAALQAASLRAEVAAALGGYRAHRLTEDAIADYLQRNDLFPKLVARLRGCRRSGNVTRRTRDAKAVVLWDQKCRLTRLCPDEAREEAARVIERYLPAVQDFLKGGRRRRVQYIVLSFPNVVPGRFAEMKRLAFKELDKALRRRAWRSVCGALATQEDPLSRRGDRNLHLNAIALIDGPFDWGEVRADWTKALRRHFPDSEAASFQVEFKEASCETKALTRAFKELIKYVTKHLAPRKDSAEGTMALPLALADSGKGCSNGHGKEHSNGYATFDQPPGLCQWPAAVFEEWWEAGLRFRRTRTYGLLHGLPKKKPEHERETLKPLGRVRYDAARGDYEIHLGGARTWAAQTPPVDLIRPDKSAAGNRAHNSAADTQALRLSGGYDDGFYDDTGPPAGGTA